MFSATISITVLPDRVYKCTSTVDAYYSGKNVANQYFVANGTTTLILQSATAVTSSVTITEYQRSYYEAYDGQGGTWAFQPSLDKWTSQYSFRPDWMSAVGNRLVTFKNGVPYVHDSTDNTFYGQAYDSAIAMVHSDVGNDIKSYTNFAVEGNVFDLTHCRTEKPNVQSTDLIAGDYENKEGVYYAALLRDRLSPNSSGTYAEKLYTGDRMRGENGLFQGVFFIPTTSRYVNFVDIGFIPSRGHQKEQ